MRYPRPGKAVKLHSNNRIQSETEGSVKIVFAVYALILVLTAGAAASGPATLEFDQSLLRVSPARLEVGYPGYEPVAVGRRALICCKTFYVELLAGEHADAISFVASERQSIDMSLSEASLEDIPTSDPELYDKIGKSFSRHNRIGMEAVYGNEEVIVHGKRYLKLTVFPVTADSLGHAFFNRSIKISVGSRLVRREQLLSYRDVFTGNRNSRDRLDLMGASDGIDYVIITSLELAVPCRELARYKTSTGYRTAVVFVDDILAACSGRDDAEKLREYLKQFSAGGGRYVLLAGDETVLPIRYAYYYATNVIPSLESQEICDLYFADLSGEWDIDSDGVWGEPYDDAADLTPELFVGRLSFNSVEQLANYVDKLIAYETSPGGSERSYLGRAFFFSSDQMRDYSGGGQHGRIVAAYPDYFSIDTVEGVEAASGDDPTPYNKRADDLIETLSDGWGIINIIAHGCNDVFAVRTSGYNDWPKSCFMSQVEGSGNGDCRSLLQNGRASFYYSLACSNGAFDKDQPPFNQTKPNLVQTLLGLPNAGAVGFVAYSRWGWVSSSHLLQKAFFDSLFAYPDRPAVTAMYASKQAYYYYRDLVYGQNFFGDPTLRVYTEVPGSLSVTVAYDGGALNMFVTADESPVESCLVVLSTGGHLVSQALTDDYGLVLFSDDFVVDSVCTVSAVKAGFMINRNDYVPTVTSDIGEDEVGLPYSFSLAQNYPNPFNPTTTIAFDLGEYSHVKLSVYNVLGQHVKTLKSEPLPAGTYTVQWDGKNDNGRAVAGGIYFYRLQTGQFTAVKKMTLLK